MRVYVLDTTAILRRKAVYDNMFTVPEVVAEVLDSDSMLYLDVKKLKVEEASNESLKIVEEEARKTGDIYKLSKTDLKVLAKALDLSKDEKDVVLVTDDYSIQNVAKLLNIKIEGVMQNLISRNVKWIKVCKGCGRKLENDICPVCGGEAKLRRLKK